MLESYYPIAILIGITVVLGALVVGLGHWFGPRRPTERKGAPYESGMMPYGPGTRQMPIRFYLVAVLFILFDVEVIFLFPWAVVYRELGPVRCHRDGGIHPHITGRLHLRVEEGSV